MFFSDNSNMCVISSWVSMNHFFPLYFHFFRCCSSMVIRYCKLNLVGGLIFLYSWCIHTHTHTHTHTWLSDKESTRNAGDTGLILIPGSRSSSGEGNGNPLQYSCLGNSMDWEAWQTSPWSHKRVSYYVLEIVATLILHFLSLRGSFLLLSDV